MNVLIVEDETVAYENLASILTEIDSAIQIQGNTESISQTVNWLRKHPLPDLIFMDIHLSDGSSFAIFDHIQVETPIIFITAYDEYAIEAFKVNSIDYLLKPIKKGELERALTKFGKYTQTDLLHYLNQLTQLVPASTPQYNEKLLIPIKDKLVLINLKEVSYIYTTDRNTHIHMKNGQVYPYSKTLDQISLSLNPANFFRANKQFIIARESVQNLTIWFDNRLLITLDIETPERIYISKNKASEFKSWIVNC